MHCSSSIANKGFGGAVSPLFNPDFTGNFSQLSYKEVPDLQEITFPHLFSFFFFFQQNNFIYCPLVPNTFEI